MDDEEGIGGIRYDAALAAGLLILELFRTSPGADEAVMVGQCTFVILEAIKEAERQLGGFIVFIESLPTSPHIHETAIRIAQRCRFIVQACLREEEWGDADREFYRVAREELEGFRDRGKLHDRHAAHGDAAKAQGLG